MPAIDPAVEESLLKVLASPLFQRADRQSRFLRHVVEHTVANDEASLKESVIGVAVYGRPADYDPRADPIVRVEASRLRARLREYYESEGLNDPIRFELPKGSYGVTIRRIAEPRPETEAPTGSSRADARWSRVLWIAAANVLLILAIFATGWYKGGQVAHVVVALDSVAVLPFADLSESHDLEYVCSGLTEQITDELSRIPSLHVAGHTSARRFQNPETDHPEIGRQLGVKAVLTGSVRTEAGRIRVTARLSEVATGFVIWSGTFDGERSGIFALQDQIARSLAEKLELRLAQNRQDAALRSSPERSKAHELFIRARHLHFGMSAEGIQRSRELYEQAVRIDPNYAAARAGLAQIYITGISVKAFSDPGLRDRAEAEARRAIDLDDGLAEGYNALVRIYRDLDQNWSAARRVCAGPPAEVANAPSLIATCASVDSIVGAYDRALEAYRRAIMLDPLAENLREGYTNALYRANRQDEAFLQAQEGIKVSPSNFALRRHKALILAATEDLPGGLAVLAEAERELGGGLLDWGATRGYILGRMGRAAEARELFTALERHPKAPATRPALVALGLGDEAAVYRYLRIAARENPGELAHFIAQRYSRELDGRPVFERLRSELKLPQPSR